MEFNIAELITIITFIVAGVGYLERKNKIREKRIEQYIQRTKENLQEQISMSLAIAKEHTELLKSDDDNIHRLIQVVGNLQNTLYNELRSKQ